MSDRPIIAREIAEAQDRMIGHLDATRGHRRARFVASAKVRPRASGRLIWLTAGAAAMAACIVAFLLWNNRTVEPEVDRNVVKLGIPKKVDQLNAVGRDASVALAGGGSLSLTKGGEASLTRRRSGAPGASIELNAGKLSVRATGTASERVQVRAGQFTVVSTDSASEVEWDPGTQLLDVNVSTGRVHVFAKVLGGHQVVVAGESVQFSAVEVTTTAKLVAPETPTEEVLEIYDPDEARPAKPSRWRKFARAGKHKDALDAAVAEGFGRIVRTANADDLLKLARAARYARDSKRATQALKAARRRFKGTGAAARAAYALGRVAFDFDRDYGGAAKWFDTYLRERPKGSLAREALGRLIESQRRSGASAAAKKNAQKYLDRHPAGPHADIARKAL